MIEQTPDRPARGSAAVRTTLIAAPLFAALMLVPGTGRGGTASVAGQTFDTANATTTAIITSGGYSTDFGVALHSGTSPSWSVPDSLGTRFLVPTFQWNYDPGQRTYGVAGSAVTLGHDPNFPQTSGNPRDIIQLGWDSGNGLANATGNDLAIFEAATSEAFGVRVQVAGSGWTGWRYTPYERTYDIPNDATLTLIDFADFGVGADAVVTALEITNLLLGDRVDTRIEGNLGRGNLDFEGSALYIPARFSTSQDSWTRFEPTKFDPDIQYVVGLNPLSTGSYGALAPASYRLPLSPMFVPATLLAVPAPPTLALLLPLLAWPLRRWPNHCERSFSGPSRYHRRWCPFFNPRKPT